MVRSFLFTWTAGIPPEQTNCSFRLFLLPRNNFCRKLPTLVDLVSWLIRHIIINLEKDLKSRGRIFQQKSIYSSAYWMNFCGLYTRLLKEDTKELDVYETEFVWNLKGLVAIAIGIRKKRLAAGKPAIQFSETSPRRGRACDRCSRLETPPPPLPPALGYNTKI
jgi:hypothetical protein